MKNDGKKSPEPQPVAKTPPASPATERDATFRNAVYEERQGIIDRIEAARIAGDAKELLQLLIAEIELFTRELKMETLMLFEATERGQAGRQMMRNVPAHLAIVPSFIVQSFFAAPDTHDVVELSVGESQANALAKRLDNFDSIRNEFAQAASQLAATWDDKPECDLEHLVAIDRHRSEVKHAAFDLCRFIDTLANLVAGRNGGKTQVSTSDSSTRNQTLKAQVDDPATRLARLRDTFEKATERLDGIPETELSSSGQPFIEECAQAVLAFAAWFGQQSPDDLPLAGNAHRLYYALGGLEGVVDWVGLRWSVPFAKEIESDTHDLCDAAEAFDKAVVKAFKVTGKRNGLYLERKQLADRVFTDLENRIADISAMASRLGGRLQRVAVWALQKHVPMNNSRSEDAVHPSGIVTWNGKTYKCDLSKKEMAFLSLALKSDSIPISSIMNIKDGLVWHERYLATCSQREKIGKLLSRLGNKLVSASPPMGMSFSLVRDSDFIHRTPRLTDATDISRTEE